MKLWLRLKMALKGFNHPLVEPVDYLSYRAVPTQPIVTKQMRQSHKQVRSLIRQDAQLQKMLGDGTYAIEVTVRDGRPLVALFKAYENRDVPSIGTVLTGNERNTRRAIFSLSYIDQTTDAMTSQGPIRLYYNPNDPLFAYDPRSQVQLVLEPIPQASARRWRH